MPKKEKVWNQQIKKIQIIILLILQALVIIVIKISFEVSIIQQGATLLNTAFEYSNQEQKIKLCEAIVERIGDLIVDKYGNYTIQTVFKLFE